MDLSKKPVDGVHADNKGYEHNGESNGTKFDLGSEGKSDVSPEEPPPKGEDGMIYNISERPPIVLAGFFGLQQALLSLSGNLSVSLLVAETVCAEEDEEFKARLLGTTLFMSGITTLLMTFFGARLPLFQGAAPDYVIPLLAMAAINKDQCTPDAQTGLQGSLIAAGAIHCIIGLTGLVGFLLRFVGPITIVPAIFLIGIYLMKATAKFAKVHWGISFMTCAISLILALYLSRVKLPVPMYTRRKGWHSIRYPYHQTFAILIAIIVGWAVCGILTATDAIEYNKNATDFYTRTDARSYIIASSNWFFWPYPGQFGAIDFSVSVFIGFLIATFTSILDSIGDYYACASIRLVFFFCGVIYLVFGIIGKFSAVFICIPYPVLAVDLSSSRNLAIIGTSIFTGLMVPHWIETFPDEIQTGWEKNVFNSMGNDKADEVLKIILGNPNMFGGVLACILDNTVPGTVEERGIAVWQKVQETGTDSGYVEGYDIYNVWLPKAVRRSRLVRFLPFLQNPHDGPIPRTLTDELRDAIGPDSTKL
ncbi:S23A2-like protein [Mya arenaria]|uniref:S23A2-like protein n=1 Tax=Mya arenaria TaxID=6604 RepID=A0ABY7FIV1_MYAAR|nr:S23A2-like protein [Mya arenaria]